MEALPAAHRAARQVLHLGRRVHHDRPGVVDQPQAEVFVLVVQEEALVEALHLLQRAAPDQHHRARDKAHAAGAVRTRPMGGPAVHPPAVADVELAPAAQQLRRHAAGGRVGVGAAHQLGDGLGGADAVGVEQQHELGGGGAPAQVVGGAEAQVVALPKHASLGQVQRQLGQGVVGAGVVDHGHPGQALQAAAQGRQAMRAVVGDHQHRDALQGLVDRRIHWQWIGHWCGARTARRGTAPAAHLPGPTALVQAAHPAGRLPAAARRRTDCHRWA